MNEEYEPESEDEQALSQEELDELAAFVQELPEKDEDGETTWNAAQKKLIADNLSFPWFSRMVLRIKELLEQGDQDSRSQAGLLIEEVRSRIKDTPGLE